MNTETPLVSVRMITYNHEKFIAQAIEGVLMQKTNFPFELIIGEDCSTDRTREIVVDYANRYPEIIKPILQERNVGANANSQSVREACTGKYVALCEGDDYWIDPLKLQKQVDFMESHPECSFCFTRCQRVNERGEVYGKPYPNKRVPEVSEFGSYFPFKATIQTVTVLYRRPKDSVKLSSDRPETNGDIILFSLLAQKGLIGFIPIITAHYRYNPKSITKIDKYAFNKRIENTNEELERLLGDDHPEFVNRRKASQKASLALLHAIDGNIGETRRILREHKNKPFSWYTAKTRFYCRLYSLFPSVMSSLRTLRRRLRGLPT